MTAAAPDQAAAHAFVTGCVARGITAAQASVPPEGQLSTVRGLWADVAQAVTDAATEGSLRACGYTLADVGRFLESEAAAREPHAADGGRSFEDMLADPREQFDPRSELLASISEYAAAPPASAGIKPWHPHGVPQPAPGLAAATDEMRGYRDALQIARSFLLDPGSRGRRRAIAVISKALQGQDLPAVEQLPQPAPELADAMAALATQMHAEADDNDCNCEAKVLHEAAARIRQLLGPEAP